MQPHYYPKAEAHSHLPLEMEGLKALLALPVNVRALGYLMGHFESLDQDTVVELNSIGFGTFFNLNSGNNGYYSFSGSSADGGFKLGRSATGGFTIFVTNTANALGERAALYINDATLQPRLAYLAGVSSRMVVADAAGNLATQAIPGGGITRLIATITTAVTLGAAALTDYVAFIGASGVVTLPTAVGNLNRYTLKNVDTTNKTVSFTGGQTADGSTTIILTPNTSVDIVSDNVNWRII